MPILDEILQYASVPVIVKPNAGLPKQKDGEVYYDVEPEEFGRFMAEILKRGASLIGGCCGTTPGTHPCHGGSNERSEGHYRPAWKRI